MVERAGLSFELELWTAGWRAVAGVDEVGRGALAGPVVAAAVILPPDTAALGRLLGRVDDSKRLTPRQREMLYGEITGLALAVGVGRCEAPDIDRWGIAPATRRAMSLALAALRVPPDYVLLDFVTLPDLVCAQKGIPHGDALSLSIAAASIIAKVTRDHWMVEQEGAYPGYGFDRHKGYGTTFHRESLERLGPCALHRMSFAGQSRLIPNGRLRCNRVLRQITGSRLDGWARTWPPGIWRGWAGISSRATGGPGAGRSTSSHAMGSGWCLSRSERVALRRTGGDPYLGRPEDSVTPKKQLQLVHHGRGLSVCPAVVRNPWRVDVMALELGAHDVLERMTHYRDAVGG